MSALLWIVMTAPLWGPGLVIFWQARRLVCALQAQAGVRREVEQALACRCWRDDGGPCDDDRHPVPDCPQHGHEFRPEARLP